MPEVAEPLGLLDEGIPGFVSQPLGEEVAEGVHGRVLPVHHLRLRQQAQSINQRISSHGNVLTTKLLLDCLELRGRVAKLLADEGLEAPLEYVFLGRHAAVD